MTTATSATTATGVTTAAMLVTDAPATATVSAGRVGDLVDALLENRPGTLARAQGERGDHECDRATIVGYLPGGYVPEELIYASGAIPVCLARGADARALDESLSTLPSLMCPFVRSQVGELLLKADPFYSTLDLVIVPSTCQHMKKVGDVVEYFGHPPVFKLGVPYQREADFELAYYRDRLAALRTRLESLTGNAVTDDRLTKAIGLYERMRRLFDALSLTRQGRPPAIDALDFVKLNHASFYADPVVMVETLEAVLRTATDGRAAGAPRPRVLLMGPNLAFGDYDILTMTADAGADIVAEDIFEGMRDYRFTVQLAGPAAAAAAPNGAVPSSATDPLDALARGYLLGKRPASFMRGSLGSRLESALELIREFDVSGVLWYQLQCCEFYDQENYYFQRSLAERGIPMLVVESDYRNLDTGPLKTRLEAFVETMTGGPADV